MVTHDTLEDAPYDLGLRLPESQLERPGLLWLCGGGQVAGQVTTSVESVPSLATFTRCLLASGAV